MMYIHYCMPSPTEVSYVNSTQRWISFYYCIDPNHGIFRCSQPLFLMQSVRYTMICCWMQSMRITKVLSFH